MSSRREDEAWREESGPSAKSLSSWATVGMKTEQLHNQQWVTSNPGSWFLRPLQPRWRLRRSTATQLGTKWLLFVFVFEDNHMKPRCIDSHSGQGHDMTANCSISSVGNVCLSHHMGCWIKIVKLSRFLSAAVAHMPNNCRLLVSAADQCFIYCRDVLYFQATSKNASAYRARRCHPEGHSAITPL